MTVALTFLISFLQAAQDNLLPGKKADFAKRDGRDEDPRVLIDFLGRNFSRRAG
ncbi:MAG: hypothetical protein GYA24_25525 [Candidatus Lokiarchaeota archaeon]|nr:hypothetical protein [Candidatus Lokiarchaeota archaeon]